MTKKWTQRKWRKWQKAHKPHELCVKTQLKHNIKYEAEITKHWIHKYFKAPSAVKVMRLDKSFTDIVAEGSHYHK